MYDLNKSQFFLGKSFYKYHLRLLKHIDYTLLMLVLGLCLLGILIIYSTTGQNVLNEGAIQFTKKQIIYILVGLLLCFIVALIDYHEIAKFALPLYFASLLMLVFVIISGREISGSKRWIQIFGFDFQPSEIAKVALIVFLADYLSRQKEKMSNLLYFSLPFLFTGVIMILINKQPDFGTAIVFLAITLFMIFIAGISWKYIIMVLLILLSLFPVIWTFLKDYQRSRIMLFLNPELDPLGAGYNIIQSKVAIGSGGLLGKGLFSGIQSQLKFLPAQHTDFVFAVIGEELGFMGALLLLSLYILLLWKGIKIAQEAPDWLGVFLSTGVISFLFIHILINIGMTMGLMPATGLPLPFISYGGTFMISNFIGIGLLLNIHIRSIFV